MNKYYIGSTSATPERRLTEHLCDHGGFTAKAKDWNIVYTESFTTLDEARRRERQLKQWKSAIRIKQLIDRSSTE